MGVHFRGATINITLAVAGKIIVIGPSPYCVLDAARVFPLTYLNAPRIKTLRIVLGLCSGGFPAPRST